MGRFLTPKDISAARHESEVYNSRLKRGEDKHANHTTRIQHVVCGCGVVGCIFLTRWLKDKDAEGHDAA